ncbi:MAG TPA: UPF0280 family protein [Terriglobales bacterium]|nr:UPF0280 family protein [Terriglobales bacterium]
MRVPPQIHWLADRRRLHLSDGPIDLIVQAFGGGEQVRAAYRAASNRFMTLLDELCHELTPLRLPMRKGNQVFVGVVARRMARAVEPFSSRGFITPMAAVAGAVAEEILEAMVAAGPLARAYVNNGGDIAFHLSPAEHFVVGMIERPDRPSLFGTATLRAAQPVRGIATSGWHGRSFSLGIADAVTVLAGCASAADAAATVIANAVDLPGHASILRQPACELAPDSDLGAIPVTRAVGELSAAEVGFALASGAKLAEELRATGLIEAAALCLRGQIRIVSFRADNISDFRSLVHA